MSSRRALLSTNWRFRDAAFPASPTPSNPQSAKLDSQESRTPKKERRAIHEQTASDEVIRESASGPCIYMGNMSYIATKADVKNFLANAGYIVQNIDISVDPFTARNPSYCFVDLDTNQAAASAMKTLDGAEFLGRPLKIKPCIQKRPVTRLQGRTFQRWQATATTTPTNSSAVLLKPLKDNRRLYVGGLPKPYNLHISDAELRKLFTGYDIVAVSKVKSPVPSKGETDFYAFVDLNGWEEAQRAARELNGRVVWGRRLRVHEAISVPEKIFDREAFEVREQEDME